MDKSLLVRNLTGGTATITASTGWAVQITSGSGARVEGFRFVGGTGSGIASATSGTFSDCLFEDAGNGYAGGAIQLSNASEVVNSTIELTATSYPCAVVLSGSSSLLQGCTISSDYVSGNGEQSVVEATGSGAEVRDNTITLTDSTSTAVAVEVSGTGLVADNWINAGDAGIVATGSASYFGGNVIRVAGFGEAIRMISGGSTLIEKNTIHSNVCDSGVGLFISSTAATFDVYNNLFVNMDYAIYVNGGSTASDVSHNIYSAPCGVGSNLSLTSTQIAGKEALFCNEREGSVRRFSHRIDSEAARGNNGWYEQVGAFDVECAWGSLARSSTIAEFSTVTVLEDVTVPSGKTLSIDSGAVLQFDDDDNSAGGNDTARNELILNGGLTVNGTSGDRVRFVSADASPAEGDWYGIRANHVPVDMSYFDVQHAVYGIKVDGVSGSAHEVNQGQFSANQNYDIWVTNSGTDEYGHLDVSNNAITVGGGTGIFADSDYLAFLTIQNNTVTGNASSVNGIRVDSGSDEVDLLGNVITDLSTGQGINLDEAEGYIRGNTIDDCKYGIKVAGWTPVIGPESGGQTGNAISNSSTTGLLIQGSGTNPRVRLNTIASNYNNVVAQTSADPDLGTTSDDGNNDLAGATNYCVWNRTAGDTVQAVGNWFATYPNLPNCSSGLVNLANQLSLDPTSRPGVRTEPAPGVGPRLLGVQPNPLRSSGVFQVAPGSGGGRSVSVSVYDVTGRLIRRLEAASQGEASLLIPWDGRDSGGSPVASGLYFARLDTDRNAVGSIRVVVAR